MSDHISEVYDRFAEVVPVESVTDMTAEDFRKSLKISFEIIGYSCKNPEKMTAKSLKNWLENFRNSSENPSLFQAIFQFWREDYE